MLIDPKEISPGAMYRAALPSNMGLQLPPNISFQSIHATGLAAGTVPHCRGSALLGVAEPHVR